MKITTRKIGLVLTAAAIIAALVYAFMPQPVAVDLATIERGPLRVTVDEDGKTRIKERYVVSSPLEGRLLRIELEVGDSIARGKTLLAGIEPKNPSLLDARALAESRARVQAAEAKLQQSEPALEQAKIKLQYAETELGRGRELFEKGAITPEEMDDLQQQYRYAQEAFRSSKFAKEIARFELAQAKAALLRIDPETNDPENWLFEIRSPIDGRVLRIFQESSTVVTPGERIMELGDPRDLELEIDVLSSDGVKIHPGDKVQLEQWGGDEPLVGVVRLVEPSAFTKVSALGVEEQRVYVIADFVTPPAERASLGDGFRVEARIIIWEEDEVLKVPTSALFRHQQQWSVFRAKNGRAEVVPVQVGHRSTLEAEVLSGLSPGDRVILHPSDKIQDGVAITPRSAEQVR